MNVLIIEDELRAAKELQRMLLEIDDTINVLGIIDSVEDAVLFLQENTEVELIFSDIHLVDGNSFSIYSQVEVKCPIIFCTAFDEYILEAFDTNAVSYVLKPITEEKIEIALQKYNSLKAAFKSQTVTTQLGKVNRQLSNTYKTTLLVDQREKIIPLPVHDIAYCYLENTLIRIVTHNNHKYYLNSSMDVLVKQLNPDSFFRANRQFIISRNAVATIEKYFSRKLVIKLKTEIPESIIVSKAKAMEFLRWIEGTAEQ